MTKLEDAIETLKGLSQFGQEFTSRFGIEEARALIPAVRPELNRAMKHVSEQIEDRHLLSPKSEETTSRVSHYTSLSAVLNMIRGHVPGGSTSLRLYDSLHSNDPEEGQFLVRALRSDPAYRWLAEGSSVGHAYIASFIMDKESQDLNNELVFWRTYGKEGTGCSLTMTVQNNLLRKVLYGPAEVEKTRAVLSPVLDAIQPLLAYGEGIQQAFSKEIWRHLEAVRFMYKDLPYEFENECRVVFSWDSPDLDRTKVHFQTDEERSLLSRVRHYYEIEGLALEKTLCSGSILTLGPTVPDQYSVELYLTQLIEQKELTDLKVESSRIPYRTT